MKRAGSVWVIFAAGAALVNTGCENCDFCAYRSGTYRVTYTEESGTCGPLPDQIVRIHEQPTAVEPPCSGTIDYSGDNCEVYNDVVCPDGSSMIGKAEWSCDGDSGEATLELRTPYCSSVYEAEYERL